MGDIMFSLFMGFVLLLATLIVIWLTVTCIWSLVNRFNGRPADFFEILFLPFLLVMNILGDI